MKCTFLRTHFLDLFNIIIEDNPSIIWQSSFTREFSQVLNSAEYNELVESYDK